MFFRSRKPSVAQICMAGVQNDLWQIGTAPGVCAELSHMRQRQQFETLSRNRHLARDMGLIR